MSNTPKTDALIIRPFGDGNAARAAFVEFARSLEMENNALRAELSKKADLLTQCAKNECEISEQCAVDFEEREFIRTQT